MARDEEEGIAANPDALFVERTEALITSGGVWAGNHDVVAGALTRMGRRMILHCVRIGS